MKLRDETVAKSVGRLHRTVHPNVTRFAKRTGKSRQTIHRWSAGHQSNPIFKWWKDYLRGATAAQVTVVLAWFRSLSKTAIGRLSDEGLRERYHELLRMDLETETRDTISDLTPELCWLEKEHHSLADAAIDEEKGAVEREFSVRRLTWSWVMSTEAK